MWPRNLRTTRTSKRWLRMLSIIGGCMLGRGFVVIKYYHTGNSISISRLGVYALYGYPPCTHHINMTTWSTIRQITSCLDTESTITWSYTYQHDDMVYHKTIYILLGHRKHSKTILYISTRQSTSCLDTESTIKWSYTYQQDHMVYHKTKYILFGHRKHNKLSYTYQHDHMVYHKTTYILFGHRKHNKMILHISTWPHGLSQDKVHPAWTQKAQ